MASAAEFISLPKIDVHNHLNLGMRYSSYTKWAGFYIPNFPRKLKGLDDMHESVIIPYTRPRVKTADDVEKVFNLSIQDAISDNVKVLEGSVDIQFVDQAGGVENFIQIVKRILDKYQGKIDFRPELGIGKTFPKDKVSAWAEPIMESGLFKSIDLYGPEIEDQIEFFVPYYRKAASMGIKRKAHIGEFSDPKSIVKFIELFDLQEIQHGITSVKDKDVAKYLADNRIRCNLCPESNVILGAVKELKDHPIKQMLDMGIECTINTDDLLLFNRTNSEQCADLVSAGVLSADEVKEVLRKEIQFYN